MSAVHATSSQSERPKNRSQPKSKGPVKYSSKSKQRSHLPPSSSLPKNNFQDDLSSDNGENGGDHLPPLNEHLVAPGSVRLTELVAGDEFDWDAVNRAEDLEVWVVRVPEGIKARHLSQLSLSEPPSEAKTSQKVGSLTRKSGTSYDVWSVRPSSGGPDSDEVYNYDGDGDGHSGGAVVGGEELLSMSVLLPRRRKDGRLFAAPKPVAQHLIVTAQASLPTPPPTPENTQNTRPDSDSQTSQNLRTQDMYKSPARYQHPKELLKHRFLPTGAGLRVPPALFPPPAPTPSTDVQMVAKEAPKVDTERNKEKGKKDKERKHKEKEERKGAKEDLPATPKKRKTEGEAKKAKKAKTEP